jgi:hypothetical protein
VIVSVPGMRPISYGWDVGGQTQFGTQGLPAGTHDAGIINSLGLTRGAGLDITGTASNNSWGARGWSPTSGSA